MIGTKLAHYEITSHIGSGGMGDVYQATDTKLGRSVAIKFLPEAFSHDSERVARFQREARVLASLNHSNIAAIYGVEEIDTRHFLVMELVSGETLADRLKRGAIPIEEALPIAKQIAEALEEAHEKGIIHRDLKPANIKVTPDGKVKVLDFGLAKAYERDQAGPSASSSPTISMVATNAGIILGTAAYMSPEQAAGKAVDRRADIWSFGVVLWEMLVGRPLFGGGETIPHTLADVLRAEIDFRNLLGGTPPRIQEVLKRCLDRDVKTRLRDIGEARVALQRQLENPSADSDSVHSRSRPGWISRLGWIAAALATFSAVAIWFSLRPTPPELRSVLRFTEALPLQSVEGGVALSSDGSRLAFVSGGDQQIYVRTMDQFEARPLSGTDGARWLSFSPDGQWISFSTSGRARAAGTTSAQSRVKKVALAAGTVQTVVDQPSHVPPFQNWGDDGYILFASDEGLQRVSSNGGEVQTLARLDLQKDERFFESAQPLPGGRWILIGVIRTGTSDLIALNPQTGEKKTLLQRAGVAQYMPAQPNSSSGHIIYYASNTGSLMAVPFDATRLELKGSPVPVLEGVRAYGTAFGGFALSRTGTLAYVPGGTTSERTLVWVDRHGVEQPLPTPSRQYNLPRLSPDGERVAVEIQDAGRADLWVYDLARGVLDRITYDNLNIHPLWTPDGKRLIYGSGPSLTKLSLLSVPADRSSPPSVLLPEASPDSISPDGKFVTLKINRDGTDGNNVHVLRLGEASAGTKPDLILDSPFTKNSTAFSPDGRLLAYQSNDTGRPEIYVQSFPGPGGKWTISTDGGTNPRWAHTGRELFYLSGERMMTVDVELAPAFRAGKPKLLFETKYRAGYDVAPDDKRFLMVKRLDAEQQPANQLHIVLNWFSELQQRLSVK